MKEFIDKLIERLEYRRKYFNAQWESMTNRGNAKYEMEIRFKECNTILEIVNELAEEYKEECNLDCDKLLFAYSDLLRRFQNAESTVICEFSGNISKETEELEAECEELLSQFKEILYSENAPQESAEEYINCSTDTSTNQSDTSTISKMENVGWIPCSERLPEADHYVLCQGNNSMFVACIDSFDGEWRDNHFYKRTTVKAWSELPAPYTEGE